MSIQALKGHLGPGNNLQTHHCHQSPGWKEVAQARGRGRTGREGPRAEVHRAGGYGGPAAGRHPRPRPGGWKTKQPLSSPLASCLRPPWPNPMGNQRAVPAGQPPWEHGAGGEEGSRPTGAKVNGRGLGSVPCLGPGTLLEDISAPKRTVPESTACI